MHSTFIENYSVLKPIPITYPAWTTESAGEVNSWPFGKEGLLAEFKDLANDINQAISRYATEALNTAFFIDFNRSASNSLLSRHYLEWFGSSDQKEILYHELLAYPELSQAWDGNADDVVPNRNAASQAICFLEAFPSFLKLPVTMVSSDGEIGLFWNDPDHLYLDVGFRGNGEFIYFGKTMDQKVKGRSRVDVRFKFPDDLLSFMLDNLK